VDNISPRDVSRGGGGEEEEKLSSVGELRKMWGDQGPSGVRVMDLLFFAFLSI
jgi:hypothetical protein